MVREVKYNSDYVTRPLTAKDGITRRLYAAVRTEDHGKTLCAGIGQAWQSLEARQVCSSSDARDRRLFSLKPRGKTALCACGIALMRIRGAGSALLGLGKGAFRRQYTRGLTGHLPLWSLRSLSHDWQCKSQHHDQGRAQSGPIAGKRLSRSREPAGVDERARATFVSKADIAAENILKEELLGARPTYGWLAEEGGVIEEGEDPTRRWIVDPLDGTTNFPARPATLGGFDRT